MSEPAKTEDLQGLTWPTPAIDLSGEGVPIQLDTLLQSLQFVATDEDRKTATAPDQTWSAETPASMQVIRSGTLTLTKKSIAWIAGFGGIPGALAAIAAIIVPFTGEVGEPVTVTLLGSAALIISAGAIALALLVKGDLEARGVATAARHQGRAEVTAAFFAATAAMPTRKAVGKSSSGRTLSDDFFEALRAYPDKVRVTTASKKDARVKSIWRSSTDPELRLLISDRSSQDEIGLEEITSFRTEP